MKLSLSPAVVRSHCCQKPDATLLQGRVIYVHNQDTSFAYKTSALISLKRKSEPEPKVSQKDLTKKLGPLMLLHLTFWMFLPTYSRRKDISFYYGRGLVKQKKNSHSKQRIKIQSENLQYWSYCSWPVPQEHEEPQPNKWVFFLCYLKRIIFIKTNLAFMNNTCQLQTDQKKSYILQNYF